MKYLKIQNDGVLDIRLVALMGGTTKANDRYKIGQFGTGLKYTLAYLFRNNLDFKIFSGNEAIDISLESEKINDTQFEIICINGHRTSITTQMGNQWNAWMIIRELWCNALDEGGEHKSIVNEDSLTGDESKTTFYIQLSADIQFVLDNWGNYFIHNQQPLWENSLYAIYANRGAGKLKLYKHGVLIYQHPNTESLFYYDVKMATINELREFQGVTSYEVFQALSDPGKEVISYFLQNVKESHYEGSELDFHWFTNFAETWRDVIGSNKIAKYGDREYYGSSGVDVDFSNVIQLPKKVYAALVKEFEGVGALAMADDKSEFYELPSPLLNEKINQAIEMLSVSGYSINPDIRIKFGLFRDLNKTCSANKNKQTIMFAEATLKLSLTDIANLLVENNEYITSKLDKDSTSFYRHFISLYTGEILAKNAVQI